MACGKPSKRKVTEDTRESGSQGGLILAGEVPDDLADFIDTSSKRNKCIKPWHQNPRHRPRKEFASESVDEDSDSCAEDFSTLVVMCKEDMPYCASFRKDYASGLSKLISRAVPLELPRNAEPRKTLLPDAKAASQKRLAGMLEKYGLQQRRVGGDGNCQFRALADQLYGHEDLHRELRTQAIQQMESNTQDYSDFVLGSFHTYLSQMRRDGTWGDHVTLQAATDALGVEVHLLTDYLTDAYIQVSPKQRKSKRVLRLCFWAEYHYNSVEQRKQNEVICVDE